MLTVSACPRRPRSSVTRTWVAVSPLFSPAPLCLSISAFLRDSPNFTACTQNRGSETGPWSSWQGQGLGTGTGGRASRLTLRSPPRSPCPGPAARAGEPAHGQPAGGHVGAAAAGEPEREHPGLQGKPLAWRGLPSRPPGDKGRQPGPPSSRRPPCSCHPLRPAPAHGGSRPQSRGHRRGAGPARPTSHRAWGWGRLTVRPAAPPSQAGTPCPAPPRGASTTFADGAGGPGETRPCPQLHPVSLLGASQVLTQ